MPRHASPQFAAPLTAQQAERIRTALRSAAGEYAAVTELAVEELEDRIMPGLSNN